MPPAPDGVAGASRAGSDPAGRAALGRRRGADGQAAAVGMGALAELCIGHGRVDPLHPSDIAGIELVTSELVLAPLGAALASWSAARGPAELRLSEAVAAAFQARGAGAALLAALGVVAAAVGSPILLGVGVLALFIADYVRSRQLRWRRCIRRQSPSSIPLRPAGRSAAARAAAPRRACPSPLAAERLDERPARFR